MTGQGAKGFRVSIREPDRRYPQQTQHGSGCSTIWLDPTRSRIADLEDDTGCRGISSDPRNRLAAHRRPEDFDTARGHYVDVMVCSPATSDSVVHASDLQEAVQDRIRTALELSRSQLAAMGAPRPTSTSMRWNSAHTISADLESAPRPATGSTPARCTGAEAQASSQAQASPAGTGSVGSGGRVGVQDPAIACAGCISEVRIHRLTAGS